MMHRDSETFMNNLLGISIDESDEQSHKEPYEAPALAIVRFMFENDITFGSFETDQEGSDADNNVTPPGGSGWWD